MQNKIIDCAAEDANAPTTSAAGPVTTSELAPLREAQVGKVSHSLNPGEKFLPLWEDFIETNELLLDVTCAKSGASQNTLAEIYGYKHANALFKASAVAAYCGPYDDEHESYWCSEGGRIRSEERLRRAIRILTRDCPWLLDGSPGPSVHVIRSLGLFSNVSVQRAAFKELRLYRLSVGERTEARESTSSR